MYLTENLDGMNEIIPKIKKTTEMLTHPYSNEIGKKNGKNGFWLTNLYIYI